MPSVLSITLVEQKVLLFVAGVPRGTLAAGVLIARFMGNTHPS